MSSLHDVVSWIGESSSGRPPEKLTDADARVRLAQAARDYIDEHYREQLRMERLCLVTGVATRTLQRAFREHYHQTISNYIKTVRLNAARRALASAFPENDSVTAIALRHGFGHLGRFAVEFRQRFGECPRDILSRR